MSRISFKTERSWTMATSDSATLLEGDDPREALVEAMVRGISTEVVFTVGGVTLHLAAWQDPEHWGQEWEEALGEDGDPEAFIAGLVEESA